jgi:hypothetical protein
MPDRDLVWFPPAAIGLGKLLARRKNRDAVRLCIIQNLFAVGRNLALAQPVPVLPGTHIYRFHCDDGDSGGYVQAELEELSETVLAVLRCDAVVF